MITEMEFAMPGSAAVSAGRGAARARRLVSRPRVSRRAISSLLAREKMSSEPAGATPSSPSRKPAAGSFMTIGISAAIGRPEPALREMLGPIRKQRMTAGPSGLAGASRLAR
jgi:hypothetical protein